MRTVICGLPGNQEIAGRLRRAMKQSGIRQTTLSELTGADYQSVHRAVNGRRPIYAAELPGIARALNVSVELLLGMEEA